MYVLLMILIAVAIAGFFAWRAHKERRLDVKGVLTRATTWLGLLTLGQGGALLAYNQAPDEMTPQLPPNIAGYLLIGMMVLGALTPVANSIVQKWGKTK